jgi:pimeloyl-ACP methyl ester carboxylesterase
MQAQEATSEQGDADAATSKDGTSIGYRRLGRGPGVVLVQGTMGTAYNFRELAEALADTFTVYLPDRRGRGMSGPAGEHYSIQSEIEDLAAVLAKTGAQNVFGLSSGAIIALQAALSQPAIRRLAAFEPPLFVDTPPPTELVARYEAEMARGDVAAALIAGMQAGQFGPPIFKLLPRRLLEWLTAQAIRSEERKGANGYAPMRELASTLHYDFQLVTAMSGPVGHFRAIDAQVLLLGGSQSQAYLKAALGALQLAMPAARRVEIAGIGHAGPWNADRGGRPRLVAQELRRFFG